MLTVDDLRHQALALPPDQRAALARELFLSLEVEELEDDVFPLWAEEAERRSDAYARGETTARDWRESVDCLRRTLDQRRKT